MANPFELCRCGHQQRDHRALQDGTAGKCLLRCPCSGFVPGEPGERRRDEPEGDAW
jgi:hypothetical protein